MMIGASGSFDEYAYDYECSPTARREREAAWEDALEAMHEEVATPPLPSRQVGKFDLLAPGAPNKFLVRMPSLEEGEIREEKGEMALVEPHRTVASLDDIKAAEAEAAAHYFWNMEAEVRHCWEWSSKQQRFVFHKTVEVPVDDK